MTPGKATDLLRMNNNAAEQRDSRILSGHHVVEAPIHSIEVDIAYFIAN
jgi:hypothetical protein